jgi:hypothetical protein
MRPFRKNLRRVLRWGVRVFAAGCLLGLLLLGLLQFDGVSTWLVTGLAGRFNPYPGTQLTVDRVSGSWIRSLRLEGVQLASLDGQAERGPELVLDSLEVHFRLLPLLFKRLEIREAEITGLRVGLTQRPDSLWNFLAPFQKAGERDPRAGREGGIRFRSGPIRLQGATASVAFAPTGPSALPDKLVVEELSLAVASLEAGSDGLALIMDTLRARFYPLIAQKRNTNPRTGPCVTVS